jgi:hypothetical protein
MQLKKLHIKEYLFPAILSIAVSVNLEAQEDRSDLDTKLYQIDSVNITAPKEYRSLLKEPYTEPFSLLPVISTISVRQIQKQGAINLIDAMTYVPGGLTETRGRQVKQFFSVRGQKYPYPDYALNGIWQQEFEELPCSPINRSFRN